MFANVCVKYSYRSDTTTGSLGYEGHGTGSGTHTECRVQMSRPKHCSHFSNDLPRQSLDWYKTL